jgi:hypothetical protein
VKIFSVTGSLIKTTTASTDIQIDMTSFSQGIYLLEIRNSNQIKRSKIIKL